MNDNHGDPDDVVEPLSHNDLNEVAKPPSVLGEEDVFSGDATNSESPDIDAELEKVGLEGDSEEGPRDLHIDKKID